MTQHDELARDVIELLGHVLADPGLGAAAGANLLLGGDIMEDILSRQVVGNRFSAMPLALPARGRLLIRLGIGGKMGRE